MTQLLLVFMRDQVTFSESYVFGDAPGTFEAFLSRCVIENYVPACFGKKKWMIKLKLSNRWILLYYSYAFVKAGLIVCINLWEREEFCNYIANTVIRLFHGTVRFWGDFGFEKVANFIHVKRTAEDFSNMMTIAFICLSVHPSIHLSIWH